MREPRRRKGARITQRETKVSHLSRCESYSEVGLCGRIGMQIPPPRDTRNSLQLPISPPSALVIATTEGRGGTPSLKSGQRVEGLS